jgi:hypothetical protein
MQSFIELLNKKQRPNGAWNVLDIYETALKKKDMMVYEIFQGEIIMKLRVPDLFFTPEPGELSEISYIYEGSYIGLTKSLYDMTPWMGSNYWHPTAEKLHPYNDIATLHDWSLESVRRFFIRFHITMPHKLKWLFKFINKAEDFINSLEFHLKFTNGYLDDDQKCLIYWLVGITFEVTEHNILVHTDKYLALDLDIKHHPEAFNVFERLLDNYHIDRSKLSYSVTKSGGYHFYFHNLPQLKNRVDHFFYVTLDEDGIEIKRENIKWDIRSNKGCAVESGVHVDPLTKKISAYAFEKLPIDFDEDAKYGVRYTPSIDSLSTDFLVNDYKPTFCELSDEEQIEYHYMFLNLFATRTVYFQNGKTFVKTASEEVMNKFRDPSITNDVVFNNTHDAKAIINEDNFHIIEELFSYDNPETIKNRTKAQWLNMMLRLKISLDPSLYEKGKKFYLKHCKPYANAHVFESKTYFSYSDENNSEWDKLEVEDLKCYPTLKSLCSRFKQLYIDDPEEFSKLDYLEREILGLVREKSNEKFNFSKRLAFLDFDSFNTVTKQDVDEAEIDLHSDIINPENRPYFLEKKNLDNIFSIIENRDETKNWDLQNYLIWMKQCLVIVYNSGNEYYLIKDKERFDGEDKVVYRSTQSRDYMTTAAFEKILKNYILHSTSVVEKFKNGKDKKPKKVDITLFDVVQKFSRYIKVNQIMKDFKNSYRTVDNSVTERYISLYNFRVLDVDNSAYSDESKQEFLEFWILSLCNLCGLKKEEIEITLKEFKNNEKFSIPKFKLTLYFYAHMIHCPMTKSEIALYIKSEPGTGKDYFNNFFISMIGDEYSANLNASDVNNNRFTSVFEGKILSIIQEISAKNMRESYDFLKELVTNSKLRIEKKGVDMYTDHNNFTRVVLYTNKERFCETADRRFLLLDCNKSDDKNYIAKFDQYFKNPNKSSHTRTLYDYLLTLTECVNFPYISELAKLFTERNLSETMRVISNLGDVERFCYSLMIQEIENTYFRDLSKDINIPQVEIYNLFSKNHSVNKNPITSSLFKARFSELFGLNENSDVKRIMIDGRKQYYYVMSNFQDKVKNIFTNKWKIAGEFDRIYNNPDIADINIKAFYEAEFEDIESLERLSVDEPENISVSDFNTMIQKALLMDDMRDIKSYLASLIKK